MWLETVVGPDYKKLLINLEAIDSLEFVNEDLCAINTVKVKEKYDDIKGLLLNGDSKYSNDMDFRVKHLALKGLINIWYVLGEQKTIEYINDVMKCQDQYQLINLGEVYGTNKIKQDKI